MIQRIMRIAALVLLLPVFNAQAQPAAEYLKAMNGFVPGSPEAAQIMKYQNYPVDLFTGTPQISYPIYTIQGKGISLPLSFSYHAGGGIKVDEQASNIGLGWSLNAGGEITREIRGTADDAGVGRFDDLITVDSYTKWMIPGMLHVHSGEWTQAANGGRDMEPDLYYYSFGPFSGKYLYDDIQKEFVCITEKSSVKISFDKINSVWKIITDDGNKYYFAAREFTSTQIHDVNSPSVGGFSSPQTTSWKLTRIVNADATDSIMLNYSSHSYRYYTAGANITYQLQNGNVSTNHRNPVNSYSYNNVDGISKLTSITSANGTLTFVDDTVNRLDMEGNEKAISKIIVKDIENNVTDIFKFNYGYYDRPWQVGIQPVSLYSKKSLRLDGFTMYGNSESNTNPLSYSFQYNSLTLPTRMSFAKDFWGYYNSNTDGTMLAPKMYLNYMNSMLPGANRSIDTVKMKAGILEKVTLPTGGTIQFVYEPNTIGYAIKEATASDPVTTGMGMYVIKDSMEQFVGNNSPFAIYDTTFIINQPPNYVTNNFMGGVIANVSIWPRTQTDHCILDYTQPYFTLEKTAGIVGSPDYNTPFGRTFQCDGASNLVMPNGVYKMKAYVSALNHTSILNSIRNFYFSVGYDEIHDDQVNNYNVAGLRIKSIIAYDPYSNKSQTRNFRYHDPETDSSYGRFLGSTLSNYMEVSYDVQSLWLIRTGSYNTPGCGNVMSNVVYAKVLEEVSDDDNTVYRIEHNYSTGISFYPSYALLLPMLDIECARGNEIQTDYKKFAGGAFVTDKTVKQVFDFRPTRMAYPDSAFERRIKGIRCSYDSYSGNLGQGGSIVPPQTISEYWNYVNRLYMTSDTTIEYANGTPTMKNWTSYKYGDYNQKPVEITSQDSKGAITMQRMGYAMDAGEPALAQPVGLSVQLALSNRMSDVLSGRQYKDGQMLNQMFKRGHFTGSQFLMDSVLYAEYNYPLEWDVKIVDYDDRANPLTVQGRGNMFRKYIWRKDRNLALATCTMPRNGAFVFTSFEYANEYPNLSEANRSMAASFSGRYAYNLNSSLAFNGFNATGGLEVYAWVRQGSFTANGVAAISTGRTKGDWTLFKASLPVTTTVTLTGTATIDQLAIVPAGSTFDANVYDVAGRVISKVNQNMQTTFFEYDAMGRLTIVRDEQGNIVKSSTYQYQVTQ